MKNLYYCSFGNDATYTRCFDSKKDRDEFAESMKGAYEKVTVWDNALED